MDSAIIIFIGYRVTAFRASHAYDIVLEINICTANLLLQINYTIGANIYCKVYTSVQVSFAEYVR